MGKKTPYRGQPHERAAKIIEDLYERRYNKEMCLCEWSDLSTGEILRDVTRELRGKNTD